MWDFSGFSEGALLRRVVRREIIRLVILTAVAIGAFFATRALASRAEALAVEDAAEWYRRGQEDLARGDPQQAATAFRRATMKQRENRRYTLALADALARSGNSEAAVRALLGLREFSPEDAEVNLALARLARARHDLTEAVRYYHHAIYAPSSDADAVRAIRFELIRMLLDAGDGPRAASELIAAAVDLPDTPEARLRIASLFREAGDPARALEQYRRVLGADAQHAAALEGAVQAAFALGDYRQVAGYRLPASAAPEVRTLVTVAREVIARDPLAGRISSAERRRRLLRNLTYVLERFKACAPGEQVPESLLALQKTARRAAALRETDLLESALAIVVEHGRRMAERCEEATPADRALGIIGRLHGIAPS